MNHLAPTTTAPTHVAINTAISGLLHEERKLRGNRARIHTLTTLRKDLTTTLPADMAAARAPLADLHFNACQDEMELAPAGGLDPLDALRLHGLDAVLDEIDFHLLYN